MPSAHADPTNAPNVEPFPITCDGITYMVNVPGRGEWAPALVTTSNQVLVPFSFDITITNLTTGETFQETVSKPPARPNRDHDLQLRADLHRPRDWGDIPARGDRGGVEPTPRLVRRTRR
jgi:hypothetical protein